ncbi:MAG: hypothetical protein ACE5JG_02640 [Planctomycetota bacterium]
MKTCPHLLSMIVPGALLLFLAAGDAGAHPGFARKYKTSCQTCHVAFPYLTPFGEAYRQSGFFFPGGADPDFIKDPPLQLGAESYKKVWPDAVWPADVSGLPPIALVIESEFTVTPDASEKTSFEGFGAGAELLAGGTIGDNVSYYAELEFETKGTEDDAKVAVERLYAIVHFFGADDPRLRAWIGRFEPHLGAVTNLRRLGDPKYFVRSARTGDNEWSPEGAQQGVDLGGIVRERVVWNVGIVEGNRNLSNSDKDFYAHLGVKLGGMPLAPADVDESTFSAPKPWAERSVEIHAYVYNGRATFADPAGVVATPQDDEFTVVGFDARGRYDNLIVDLAFDVRNHDTPVFGSAQSRDVFNFMIEAAYIVYPWLIPALRYELLDEDGQPEVNRISLTVNFLIRANVKGQFAWVHTDDGASEDEFVFALVIGF